MTLKVDHLKKVELLLQAGTRAGQWDLTRQPKPMTLICGAASAGMCPFEYQLIGKAAGEALELTIPAVHLPETMAHLMRPLRIALELPAIPPVLSLRIAVQNVSDPTPREVIRAMADAANQEGCGGDCDCGCGGH